MKIENRGGIRQGSGRKSKAYEQKIIEKLDSVIEELYNFFLLSLR